MKRLETSIIYGLRTDVQQNVHYVRDDEILYIVGKCIAIHNFTENRQKIISLADRHQINIIDVSPNKKYAALCECGEKPTISIYNLLNSKRLKSLVIPFETSDVISFKCISFSFDNKNIAAVMDGADQMMLFYNWEKGKVVSSIKLGNTQNPTASVDYVACNPSDVGIAAVAGYHVFKFLTASETQWRPYGFSKADNIWIKSIAWVNGERLFAGTDDGKILYLENGDLKNVYIVENLNVINLNQREDNAVQMATWPNTIADSERSINVYCIKIIQKGLAFAYGCGKVLVFQKVDNSLFRKNGSFEVPEIGAKIENKSLYNINNISASLNNDKLVVSCGWSQLFCTTLWKTNIENEEVQKLELLGQPLHQGNIKFMSTCPWKSIFVTYSDDDRILKVWNFLSESVILKKQFSDDITCISLHPTGLYCFLGFVDKIKLMSILLDDMITTRELKVTNCKKVLFSRGGHLFALVLQNMIKVIVTVSFYCKFVLKGHVKNVEAMEWSYDDSKLYTVGLEGAIYEWDMNSGTRSGEVVLKNVTLRDIAVNTQPQVCYSISDDHFIRRIEQSKISKQVSVEYLDMRLIRMGKINETMFIGCSNGEIAAGSSSLQEPFDCITYDVHCHPITQLNITYHEDVLVTADSSGTLCFWKILLDVEDVTFHEKIFYTMEVLIGTVELIEKNGRIEELSLSLKELKSNHEYDIRKIQNQHEEKLTEIHQSYTEIVSSLREKITELDELHDANLSRFNLEMAQVRNNHEKLIRQTETNYETKLRTEYEKYDDLVKESETMKRNYEKQMEEFGKMKTAEIQEIVDRYTEIIEKKDANIRNLNEQLQHEIEENKKMLAMIEDDADREILELRTDCARKFYEERQKYLELEGQVGACRNKYAACQDENHTLKQQISNLEEKMKNLLANLEELKISKQELMKSVKECNIVVEKKEEDICELAKSNLDLEKYSTVLKYKINEFEELIKIRDYSIQEFHHKTAAMEVETQNLNKIIKSQKIQLQGLQDKVHSSQLNFQSELDTRTMYQRLLKRMRNDLFDAAELIQHPNELKKLIIKMHHNYNQDPDFLLNRKNDFDAQDELKKQNIKLKTMLEMLQKHFINKRLRSPSVEMEQKFNKLLNDNLDLINDLEEWKTKYELLKKKMNNIEAILGLKKSTNVNVNEARNRLDELLKDFEESQEKKNKDLKELERIINVLKKENDELLTNFKIKKSIKRRISI